MHHFSSELRDVLLFLYKEYNVTFLLIQVLIVAILPSYKATITMRTL